MALAKDLGPEAGLEGKVALKHGHCESGNESALPSAVALDAERHLRARMD